MKARFSEFLQGQLTKLKDFLVSNVLLGISPEFCGISCKISNAMDMGDLDTPGLGPFLPEAHSSLNNHDSRRFQHALTQVVSDHGPVKRMAGRKLHWDKGKSMMWLVSCNIVWQLIYSLIHSLGGLARQAAKKALNQWNNKEFGSPTHLCICGHTVALNMNYYKGGCTPGCTKTLSSFFLLTIAHLVHPPSCGLPGRTHCCLEVLHHCR